MLFRLYAHALLFRQAVYAVQTRPFQPLTLVPVYRVFCFSCEYVTMQSGFDWTLNGLPTLPRSI